MGHKALKSFRYCEERSVDKALLPIGNTRMRNEEIRETGNDFRWLNTK